MNAMVKWFIGIAACLAACVPAAPALGAAGFGEIAGPGGCLLAVGAPRTPACGDGRGLSHPKAVAVSPDGTNVYVVGGVEGNDVALSFGEVVVLKRNPATGEVSDVGCLSSDGTDGRDGASGICTPTPSLLGADGVTVGADGHSVYVIARSSGSVVAFRRDPATGLLTRLGCFQTTPRAGSPCTPANLFQGATDLLTDADGAALYIASPGEGVISTLLAPVPAGTGSAGASSGAANGLSGASPSAASRPGGSTEAASTGAAAAGPSPTSTLPTVASLFSPLPGPFTANPCIAVNGLDGPCSVGVAMAGVSGLALAPGGKQLYAAAANSKAIDTFSLAAGGALAQSGCLMESPPPGMCTASRLLRAPAAAIAISPDGRNLYVGDHAPREGGRIDILSRNPATGSLADAGCVAFLPVPERHEPKEEESGQEAKESEREEKEEEEAARKAEEESTDGCASVPGLESVDSIAISADGSQLYAFGSSSAVSFARASAGGGLTETACASESDPRCTAAPDLSGVQGAAVSPDGRDVYVASSGSKALLGFGLGASVTSTAARVSRGLARVAVACPARLSHACRGRVVLTAAVDRRAHSRHRRRERAVRIAAGRSGTFWIAAGGHKTITVWIGRSAGRLLLRHRRLRVTAAVASSPFGGGSDFGRRLALRMPARP